MIILHFHLQPQYRYELFHINFTSLHCTKRYELNKLTSLPMCGFIAQLVEHRTGIAEVTGSNPVEALIFFRLLLSNCLNWKIYCDDHPSLSCSVFVLHHTFSQSLSRCCRLGPLLKSCWGNMQRCSTISPYIFILRDQGRLVREDAIFSSDVIFPGGR